MSDHRDYQQKIRMEIKKQVSNVNKLSLKDVQNLPLLTSAIKETMRLYPVVPILIRQLNTDDTITTYDQESLKIYKGQRLLVSLLAIHRSPDHFTNPDEFIPERFMEGTFEYQQDEDLRKRNNISLMFSYMPFGQGSRSCVGNRFAMVEMVTLAAAALYDFEFQLSPDVKVCPQMMGIMLKPKNLKIRVVNI